MNKLKLNLAFLIVILIWTSTPLAVQWSSASAPLHSVLFRMLIGVMLCIAVLGLFRMKLSFDVNARRLYVVGGISMFLAMSLVYVAAQSIPSGWISVIFGLSPILTGIFAAFIEPNSRLTPIRTIGASVGLFGLFLVFRAGLAFDSSTLPGISLLLIAVLISSTSSIWIRELSKDSELQPMQINTGSLLVSIPCFALSAYLIEPSVEINFSTRELIGILYLGLIGTGIGFTLYYFLLKQMAASKVALIMLITPISALLLGNLVNSEPVIQEVWIGAICVTVGLILYEYRPKFGLGKL